MNKYKNPYRPGSGMFPPYFAGRQNELSVFNKKFQSTKSGIPMHLAVLGDWAMGKTSLLKKFMEISEEECFVHTYIAGVGDTTEFFSSLIKGMSLKMTSIYGENALKKISKKVGIKEMKISLFGLSADLKFSTVGDAQISFKEYLLHLWEEIKKEKSAGIIMIDDLDTIEDFKNTMMVFRNALMEVTELGCRYMVVVSGTSKLFELMYEAHAPLVRFFEPLTLVNLDDDDARKAIVKPLVSLNISIDDAVVDRIISFSCGQPYYLQEICFHAFEASNDDKITSEDFELGFEMAFSDIVKLVIERRASELSKNEMKLLSLLQPKKPLTYSDILDIAQKKGMKKATANTSLNRLKGKDLINQITVGEQKGKYIVYDALLLLYLRKVCK